ncbi:hypothetical protein [Streptomyces sp. NPDC008150]|uniref:hypothetical protein n=1 Tax=Streptomyces sp. NPDC008150 TaxID=3364816 RepID=UPI0036E8C465
MTQRVPDYVSFTTAAALIVEHGIASSMTSHGLRYMARARTSLEMPERERWPFGDAPYQEPYLSAGRTRMMRTELLLAYLRKHPPRGRGPARKPGATEAPEQ